MIRTTDLVVVAAKPKPLPQGVRSALATVEQWVQIIGGGLAVIGLMILFISLFFGGDDGRKGREFREKAGWWITGAVGLGLAGVIAPVFTSF